MKNKKGQAWMPWVVLGLLVVIAVALVRPGWIPDRLSQEESGGISPAQLTEIGASAISSCPTDKDTSLTLTVQNYLNDTGAEQFDTTVYVLNENTGEITTLTDTTSPSASTVPCGDTFTAFVVAEDGNGSDNSKVEKIILGGDTATLNSDGSVTFVTSGPSYALRLGVSQHGVLEFRAKDMDADAFAYNSDGDATDYETDGVSFESSSNGTAKAIGTAGQLHYQIEARANSLVDVDFNDYYTLIAVEAPKATWNEPTLKVDGEEYTDAKGTLTDEEEDALSSYEYIYKVDKRIRYGGKSITVDLFMEAKSGVDPSVDPEVDFATAGRYLSVDGVTTKVGTHKDDSSLTAVFAIQDVTLNIS